MRVLRLEGEALRLGRDMLLKCLPSGDIKGGDVRGGGADKSHRLRACKHRPERLPLRACLHALQVRTPPLRHSLTLLNSYEAVPLLGFEPVTLRNASPALMPLRYTANTVTTVLGIVDRWP